VPNDSRVPGPERLAALTEYQVSKMCAIAYGPLDVDRPLARMREAFAYGLAALGGVLLPDAGDAPRAEPVSDALALIRRALAMRDYGDKPVLWEQVWKDITDAAQRLGDALAVGAERGLLRDTAQWWGQNARGHASSQALSPNRRPAKYIPCGRCGHIGAHFAECNIDAVQPLVVSAPDGLRAASPTEAAICAEKLERILAANVVTGGTALDVASAARCLRRAALGSAPRGTPEDR